MMRKYFPLEVIERLFIAVDDNDVIDTQVSLPPTITLRCSPEIIHDNYALCLRFWLDGVNRKELLRLTLKQAKAKYLQTMSAKRINTCGRAISICVSLSDCI